MTSWPRISIVTPSYNQGRYIRWTVQSVLHQRYPNLEYIVMDGGSNDETTRLLSPYLRHFAHYVSERDKGQADALAKGFARSTGDIMGWVNSDDILAPGALHAVEDFFKRHPGVDAVYGHRVIIDANNRVTGYWMMPRHNTYMQMRWDMIPQETCFWRRRLFERAGNVDASFRFAMDYDLFARYMRAGRFARIDRFLGAFRKHDESKTTTLNDTVGRKECALIWKKQGLRSRWFHRLIAARMYNRVHRRGHKFALSGRPRPGVLPGSGYDYDAAWGGLLTADV